MPHASKATCAFIILTLVACGSEPSTPGADGGTQETSNPPAGDATSPGEDTATPQGDAGAPQEDATAPQGDANTSGTETLAEGCCMTDDDCPEAWQMCVGEGDGSPGRCAQEPAGAQCYEETCPPLHICLGDVTCGCGESCDTTMGYSCVPVEGDCCEDDTECPTGGVCRAGTCVVSLGENGCWGSLYCQFMTRTAAEAVRARKA